MSTPTNPPLIIDDEFRKQIPPPAPEELAELERDIVDHGIRDALVVWEGHGILLDGHNRYEIAKRNGLTFATKEYAFPDRVAAANWIDRNQLGRRNLTPDQLAILQGRIYNRAKLPTGGVSQRGLPRSEKPTAVTGGTAARLAEEFGINRATVIDRGNFAAAVETLKAVDPDIEKRVISGKGPTRAQVKYAASLVEREPERAVAVLTGASVSHPADAPKPAGWRNFPGRPLAEQFARGLATLESMVDTLGALDVARLNGDGEAFAARLCDISRNTRALAARIRGGRSAQN